MINDAMVFLPVSVSAEAIREEAAYQGVRVKVEARLGKIKLPLQVDIGFGDAVTPKAEKAEFPPLLDFPAPRLSMYGRETVVAEKFEAMVVLGLGHSRMTSISRPGGIRSGRWSRSPARSRTAAQTSPRWA